MIRRLIVVLFLLAICVCSKAQLTFVRCDSVQVIDDSLPLKNAWAGGFNYPMFNEIDLNGDGIMDLVVYEPGGPPGHDRLMPFINHGDSGKVDYIYAPEYIPLFPHLNQWLVTYDYNCDGKMDLFSLDDSCSCGIMVYRNDYTGGGGLKFTKLFNNKGGDYLLTYYPGYDQYNIAAGSVTVPGFADVDGDGAMDIIGWPAGNTISLSYYRGLWADSSWSCDSLRFNQVDADCWGYFALTQGTNLASLGQVCRVMATDSALLANAGTTMVDDTQSCICIYEQDGNRTKDLLVGGFNDNNELYLHNGGPPYKDSMDYQDVNWPVYNRPVNLATYPCAYNLDVDNDKKKDMIISPHAVNDYRGILYYKNMDLTADTPVFARQPHTFLQEEMIEVGTSAAPQIFDYNCDGLPDLVIGDQSYTDTLGNVNKGIALYKNIGTATAPKFQLITRDFAGINELNGLNGPFCSTFGDLNNDGYVDMIVGSVDGNLYYFQNTACPADFIPPTAKYMGINVDHNSDPQLYDLNHDGLLDLVVGNYFGIIKYYQNIGDSVAPMFDSVPTKDTLGGIIIQNPNFRSGYVSPVFYHDHGVDKLIVGTEDGEVYVYDNITGNITGNYTLEDSIINGEEGQNLIPAIGDLNNDGHPDMIIGNYNGGVSLYMNSFPTGIHEQKPAALPGFNAYPNPASDELHLNYNHLGSTEAHLEIVNSIGQTVYSSVITGQQMTVSLKNLSNGIYLVRLISNGNSQSLKIVVRR